MTLQLKDLYLMVLKKLDEESFVQFKTRLSTLNVKKKYQRIPSSQLEGADPQSVIDLILEFYTEFYGITVIQAVLDAINKKELWNKVLDELKENGHFLDLHRSDLIEYENVRVDPILYYLHYLKLLTDEQYEDITKQPTYQEKMEGLLDTVRCWDDVNKATIIIALKCYNPEVLELRTDDRLRNAIKIGEMCYNSEYFRLKGRDIGMTEDAARMHFLEKYKEKLIKNILMVDPVLDDLRDQQLLTQRQHTNLMKKTTPQEKMRSLYDTVRTRSYPDKEKMYKALKKYNYGIIRNLLTQEGRFDYDFQMIFRNHFLDGNQKELIEKIRNVDPVLQDLLDQRLLTEQQYNKLREKPSSEQKMRSLCDMIYNWSYTNKDKVYNILRRHNYEELRALELSYVPSLLDGDLSEISPPDYLYIYGLPEYQGAFNKTEVEMMVPPLSPHAKEHFLDSQWSFLIQKIKFADPVLFDLRDNMLITQEEFQNLISKSSSREKMCELFGIISFWDHKKKDLFYDALWKYNDQEMSMLEGRYQKMWDPESLQSESTRISVHKRNKLIFLKNMVAKDIGILSHHMECRLCGKFQDSGSVLNPDVLGNIFRIELESAGLFCCQKTGIKFQVTGPLVIIYSLESWSDYLEERTGSKHEIIGPLFNIKIYEQSTANAVSAVYLPHYLCLRSFTGDPSSIKCAHFIDGNMTLKSPSRVEPFYIVLENPTFSCLGPLLSLVKKKIPIHGIILVYFRIVCPGEPEYQEYKIHLHLLPLIAHIGERLDKEKTTLKFKRIAKPPQTHDTVYTKTKYLITSRPQDYVRPKVLILDNSVKATDPWINVMRNNNNY
ncbi:uncharacterized protein LOC120913169 isoform X2 [Rana temporaria]|uniref:uncharacterized protein LOC120913169 isoform X2 n=1 Tax=Rana temporaria TaxID=8407 RepID=UPI001AADE040|nr:uncharacterized protein LOC120913169 isoform X2 [Rana temporaria]